MREEIGVQCPDCGGDIVMNFAKGRVFYGCSNYPECKFSSWDIPTQHKCPECSSMMYYKKTKKQLICSNKDCKYTEIRDLNFSKNKDQT